MRTIMLVGVISVFITLVSIGYAATVPVSPQPIPKPQGCVDLTGLDYYIMNESTILCPKTYYMNGGIWATSILINSNNTVLDCNNATIDMLQKTPSVAVIGILRTLTNLTIKNCNLINFTTDGIIVRWSDRVYITNNTIEGAPQSYFQIDIAQRPYPYNYYWAAEIINNTLKGNVASLPNLIGGISLDDIPAVAIINNVISNESVGIRFESHNASIIYGLDVIEYNIFKNNNLGIDFKLFNNSTISSNDFINNTFCNNNVSIQNLEYYASGMRFKYNNFIDSSKSGLSKQGFGLVDVLSPWIYNTNGNLTLRVENRVGQAINITQINITDPPTSPRGGIQTPLSISLAPGQASNFIQATGVSGGSVGDSYTIKVVISYTVFGVPFTTTGILSGTKSPQVIDYGAVNGWQYNYWSDYTGTDLSGDGIGDTSYIIDNDTLDPVPKMQPNPNAPSCEPQSNQTDTQPPSVSKVFPPSAYQNYFTMFGVAANDNVEVKSCSFYWDSQYIGEMGKPKLFKDRWFIEYTPTESGKHKAYGNCTDSSGNWAFNETMINVIACQEGLPCVLSNRQNTIS